jgi:hypothetical protein
MSQQINLTLKTTDISLTDINENYYGLTVTTLYGQIYNNRSGITFFNIDLKKVLGDLYEKYERFNISLNYIAGSSTGLTTETINNNKIFNIKMTGLQFTSTYNHKTGINNNIASMGILSVPLTTSTYFINFNDANKYTFLKQNYVNLDIKLMCIDTDSVYTSVQDSMLGHLIFSFNIEGVDEYHNNDITSHRLKIK